MIFVYDGSGPEAARAGIAASRQLLEEIGTLTPEGRAWEIDARLRPEGDNGQLARSWRAMSATTRSVPGSGSSSR